MLARSEEMGVNGSQTMISLILALISAINISSIVMGSSALHPNKTTPCVDIPDIDAFNVVVKPDRHKPHEPRMDYAVVTIKSLLSNSVELCAQSDECYECAYVKVTFVNVTKTSNQTIWVDTRFPVKLRFSKSNGIICEVQEKFEQYGQYLISLSSSSAAEGKERQDGFRCSVSTEVVPLDSNISVYVTLGVLAGLSLIWIVLKFMYRKRWFQRIRLAPAIDTERLINSDLGTPSSAGPAMPVEEPPAEPVEKPPKRQRLKSLDAFRGFSLVVMIFVNYKGGRYWFFHHSSWNGLTVADLVFPWFCLVVMIFVNYGGGAYWYFNHSLWNGLTVADLVFPWFVFIMGTSIALAFRGQLVRNIPRRSLLWKVVKRTVILFGLGLVLSNPVFGDTGGKVEKVRIPGVLQRLAATYCVIALMEVIFARTDDPYQDKWWKSVRDIVGFWPEWLISLSLVTVHLCLTFLMPVDGCPTGYLGPGGLHDNGQQENCTGGAAGAIDRWFFSPHHIYGHVTSKHLYLNSANHDPEGILGTLTSVFICFLGLQAGKILLIYHSPSKRIFRWIVWALITGLIAGVLCKFNQNDGWIPVNKNLWSLSFVLALSSMAFLLLAVFYLFIDVFPIWSGAPFFYPGMNSILIYTCHEVFGNYFPVQFHVEQTHADQLAMSVWGTALWVVVSVVLYYNKVFVAI